MAAEIISIGLARGCEIGKRDTKIIISDYYQNYAGGSYEQQKMEVRLNEGELEELIANLQACLIEMRSSV